jgi:hypothetical protein
VKIVPMPTKFIAPATTFARMNARERNLLRGRAGSGTRRSMTMNGTTPMMPTPIAMSVAALMPSPPALITAKTIVARVIPPVISPRTSTRRPTAPRVAGIMRAVKARALERPDPTYGPVREAFIEWQIDHLHPDGRDILRLRRPDEPQFGPDGPGDLRQYRALMAICVLHPTSADSVASNLRLSRVEAGNVMSACGRATVEPPTPNVATT